MTNFIPDHKYDNTRYAVEDCIEVILRKEPVEWMPHLTSENLRLNNHHPVSEEEFKKIVNRFKEVCEDITADEIKDVDFSIDEKHCKVKGIYNVTMKLPLEEINLKGTWLVEFIWDGDYWEIVNVQIEGINF